MGGRPPKSVEQHLLDGTYQKCRHADRGTNLEPLENVDCPESVTGKARVLCSLGPGMRNILDLALKYEQEFEKVMAQFGDTPVNAARVRGNVTDKKLDTDAILKIIGNG